MTITVNIKAAVTHCYKYDEPCNGCPDSTILKNRTLLTEVKGHKILFQGGGFEKEGFSCNDCIALMKKNPEMTIVEQVQ